MTDWQDFQQKLFWKQVVEYKRQPTRSYSEVFGFFCFLFRSLWNFYIFLELFLFNSCTHLTELIGFSNHCGSHQCESLRCTKSVYLYCHAKFHLQLIHLLSAYIEYGFWTVVIARSTSIHRMWLQNTWYVQQAKSYISYVSFTQYLMNLISSGWFYSHT